MPQLPAVFASFSRSVPGESEDARRTRSRARAATVLTNRIGGRFGIVPSRGAQSALVEDRRFVESGGAEGASILDNPRYAGPDANPPPPPEPVIGPPPPPDPIRAASDAARAAREAGERRRGRAMAASRASRPTLITGQRVGTSGSTILGRAMRRRETVLAGRPTDDLVRLLGQERTADGIIRMLGGRGVR